MDRLLSALRAAAEPTRLRILALCARGELTVSDLTQILGQSQPRVSRHLKLLVDGGLLQRFREGVRAFYRVTEAQPDADLAHALIAFIPEHDVLFGRDLERLQAVKEARAEQAAAFFRKNAERWDQIRRLYVNDEEVEKALLKALPQERTRRLLDIGTGTGRILEVFGEGIERGVGVDLSHEMLALARVNLEKRALNHCSVRYGDMNQLPFIDDTFDAATFHLALHYAEDPGAAIREASRLLRNGGRLVVVDFAPHAEERLRTEHAHRWLGFEDEQMARWFRRAGLAMSETVRLPGRPLTVCLWIGTRVAEETLVAQNVLQPEERIGA